MIAQLTLTMLKTRRVVATLDEEFVWQCDDLLIKTYLNSSFGRESAIQPSDELPGHREARLAALAAADVGWTTELWLNHAEQDAA